MHWGVRSAGNHGPTTVEIHERKGGKAKIKVIKGGGRLPSVDAVNAKSFGRIAEKSGTQALSNKKLQALVTRINLEKQYSNLKAQEPTTVNNGKKFLKGTLAVGRSMNEVVTFVNSPVGKLITKQLIKKR